MAVAGKAAITMHGAWSSTTDYDRLCGVVHNNSLFISRKKPPIGVAPTEGEYWMLCIEGVNEQDLDELADRVTNIEAKYFPKAGGTLLGDMTIQKVNNGQSKIFKNHSASADYGTEIADIAADGRKSRLVLNASAGLPPQWYDKDGNGGSFYGVFNKPTANDVGALPLSGGVIKGNGATPLDIQCGNSDKISQIAFFNNLSERLGYLGFNGTNVPQFTKADASARYTLYHEGNKPFGSYTGNGSATSRTINTGGIGRMILIYEGGSNKFLLVTPQGAIWKGTASGDLRAIDNTACYFANGNLYISTTDSEINSNGVTYYYQVL